MKTLFIIWQDPEDRSWRPVGRLRGEKDFYEFVYTEGATRSRNFIPFGRLQRLDRVYYSDTLFPLFANRLLPKSRPEYDKFLSWLGMCDADPDPLELLSLTGGLRQTDSLSLYAPPVEQDGLYRIEFFCHGLRHLPMPTQEYLSIIKVGAPIYLMLDVQNPFDPMAVALRTDDPPWFLGYVPRYMAADISQLLTFYRSETDVTAKVARVNDDAPLQFRLLCEASSKWPEDFEPCTGEDFKPLVSTGFHRLAAG